MSIAITNPATGARFDLEQVVNFSGTASGAIGAVKLVADGAIELGQAPISNGAWTFARIFHTPGTRQIRVFGMNAAGVVVSEAHVSLVLRTQPDRCDFRQGLFTIGGHMVFRLPENPALFFRAGMTIDADGAPHAYHPDDVSGLDALQNAKDQHGHFVGIVVGSNGHPAVQKAGDPAPGFFVSQTTLVDPALPATAPHRYVNAETIPYIVLPGAAPMQQRMTLGDFAVVFNGKNCKHAFAIYADRGPKSKLGEGSIALAKALDIPSSPRHGGTDKGILYVVFPGSRAAFRAYTHAESVTDINAEAGKHFAEWGGMERIKACFSELT